MGVVASGSSVGGACLPVMFAQLIPRVGFPWAMWAGALVLLCCYVLAMAASRSRSEPGPARLSSSPPPPPSRQGRRMLSFAELLDYGGFLDVRYACLSAGAVVASLGVYVPLYYIGESLWRGLEERLELTVRVESYCTIIDPNTNVTTYLLPVINGVSLFGRILH